MSESETPTPGFFGKVPGLGDFVYRRLPRSFRDPWDEWLQTVVAASKVQLRDAWLNTYLSSPIWRWTLPAGPARASAWAGVVMPSVDRVGRYFPLTIAVRIPPQTNPFRLAQSAAAWFDAAEALALSTLDEGDFELDAFSESVAALGACGDGDQSGGGDEPPAMTPWRIALPSLDGIGLGLADLAFTLARSQWAEPSVWWTDGSDLVEPSLLMCDGLPDDARYLALLDGNWAQRGWHGVGRATVDESAGERGDRIEP